MQPGTTNQPPVTRCIFCSKNFIEKSFCTSAKFSAFYNIAPILPGHSLVVPNKHFESLCDLTDTELGEMMIFARKITEGLMVIFECDGFDWTIQDGVSAGQTVPHLHLHIIPRKPFDMINQGEWYTKIPQNEKQMLDSTERERLSTQDYTAITEKLVKAFSEFEIKE